MTLDAVAQPPITIYKPQLLEFRPVTSQTAKAKRVGKAFEVALRSRMNGQSYKLTLRGPKVELQPIEEAELRQRFSAGCDVLDVYLDKKSLHFSNQIKLLFAINCTTCTLECLQENDCHKLP